MAIASLSTARERRLPSVGLVRMPEIAGRDAPAFFTKTSTISLKSFSSSSFDRSTPVMATANLFYNGCMLSGIDQLLCPLRQQIG